MKLSLIIFLSFLLNALPSRSQQRPLTRDFDSLKILEDFYPGKLVKHSVITRDSLYGTHGEFTYVLETRFTCFFDSTGNIQLAFTHPAPGVDMVYDFVENKLVRVIIYDLSEPDYIYEVPTKNRAAIFVIPGYRLGTKKLEEIVFNQLHCDDQEHKKSPAMQSLF